MRQINVIYPEQLGTISPEIYGHFSEQIGGVFYDGIWVGKNSDIPNINGFRKTLIEKLKKIKPSVIRWPGGCFAETYHWRDGVGKERPVRPGWWTSYDGRCENNEVGTHEFLEFCELVGAKAYMAVNVTSITPMEARAWMDYCLSPRGTTTLAIEREANGHPEPFDIPYWGIGNENWGGGGNMSPEYYALEYRRFSTILKNICGDRSQLIVGGADADSYRWTQGIVANLADCNAPYDAMSFHYYCRGGKDAVNFRKEDWYSLLESAEKIEKILCRHAAIIDGYGTSEKMKLIIDEWGCWHPENSGPSKGYNLYEQQSTMRDALVAALTLNIFNNHCDKVKMANVAQLCNNIQSLFLAGGEYCITTPTYHVFDMFKEHQGAVSLRTLVSDNDDIYNRISASSSVRDNHLKITLANYSCEEDVEIKLNILGMPGEIVSVNGTVLAAEDMCAHNTFEDPENVIPVNCIIPGISEPVILPRTGVMSLDIELKSAER